MQLDGDVLATGVTVVPLATGITVFDALAARQAAAAFGRTRELIPPFSPARRSSP